MEFNAASQYLSPGHEAFLSSPNRKRNRHSMIYHYGSVPMNNTHRLEPLPASQADNSTAWSALQPTDLNSKLVGRPVAYHENGSHDAGQHALDVNGTNQSFFNLQTTAPPVTEYPTHSESLQAQATSYWESKGCKDLDFTNIDADMSDLEHHGYQDDGETPTILNLRQYTNLASESDQSGYSTDDTRRQSSSSFALSSNGALADLPPFDDFPSSETASYTHDAPSWNTHNQDHTNHLLSPLVSPRRSHDISRSNSRTRASPNIRSSPYSLDSTRNKRWSTGMYTPTSTPFGARNISQTQDRFSMYPQQRPTTQHSYTQQSVPTYLYKAPTTFSPYTPQAQNVLYSQSRPAAPPAYPTYFPSPEQQYQLHVPRPVPSQGAFRLLQSNVDRPPGCASHFADLSDPPDLYSSLTEPPCDPPSPDMHPTDPDLTPHEQELRFGGDLYTPRFVRGHGNKREGWCGLCKPGRWLVLKNSAFWYDKLFTHGVNAATGAKFQEPGQVRRMESNPDVWEGLCGGCGEWVSLVSSKKKGTTWFRHAYKCHTHQKVKDGPKRRREPSSAHGNTTRARAASSASSSATPAASSSKEREPLELTFEESSPPHTKHKHARIEQSPLTPLAPLAPMGTSGVAITQSQDDMLVGFAPERKGSSGFASLAGMI